MWSIAKPAPGTICRSRDFRTTETEPSARVAPSLINRGWMVAALTGGGVGWWATRVGGSTAFVGRDRELSRLRAEVGGDTRLLL